MDAYEQLAKAIETVLEVTEGTWQERAEKVQAACADVDLDEFLSWFDN
jgi:hypothetical protein